MYSKQARQIILIVVEYFKRGKTAGKPLYVINFILSASEATGIGEATIKRLMKTKSTSEENMAEDN